jgi:hypothetical protein
MDETDMGPNAEPGAGLEAGTTTEEAATSAEQLRNAARAHLPEAESHFSTPSWMDRGEVAPVPRVLPQVPVQAQPLHDELHAYAPIRASEAIPEAAHWVERRRPRVVVGVLLTLSLLGAIASLVVASITQDVVAIVALAACGFLAVVFRATLMSKGVTTTDLKGTTLKVRTGGDLQIFKLDDPDHIIQVVGQPDSPGWKVILEAPDGRIVTLDASLVNAQEMHPVALYYHAVAERERDRRHARFNR